MKATLAISDLHCSDRARVRIRITRFVAVKGRTPDGVSALCASWSKRHDLDPCQETYGDRMRGRAPRNICRVQCGMVICRVTVDREICDQTLERVIEQTASSRPPTKNRYTVRI